MGMEDLGAFDSTGNAPPHNVDAEKAVLGSMIIEREALEALRSRLRVEDFYFERHQIIFRAILWLVDRGDPVDFITLSNRLEQEGTLAKAGGVAALTDLGMVLPTAAHAEHYADIVKDLALRRNLRKAGISIAKVASEADTAEEAIQQATAKLEDVEHGMDPDGGVSLADTLQRLWLKSEANDDKNGITGLDTGFKSLNYYLGGLQPTDLVIIAARPAMGKTAFALTLGKNVAQSGKRVEIITQEMSDIQLASRLLALESGVPVERFNRGGLTEADWKAMVAASPQLANLDIIIDEQAKTPAAIRRSCWKYRPDVLIIDYLQLLEANRKDNRQNENRQQEISQISRQLKALAKEFRIPVIALSQLSREVEKRQDKRPMLSDLRESGAIEQDADIVAFLYRDEYYNPETETPGIAEFILAKHRQGAVGMVPFRFIKELTRFEELSFTPPQQRP